MAEVVGNREAISKFEKWLKSWETGIPSQRATFLHGPPGICKTVTVETSARDIGWELVEKNASDYRTEEKIRQFAGLASQYSGFFGKNRVILLDEMDGVYGTVDRGAIPAITQIIKNTRCPIVLVANDFWNKKFMAFRDKKKYFIIEFKKPPASGLESAERNAPHPTLAGRTPEIRHGPARRGRPRPPASLSTGGRIRTTHTLESAYRS